MTGIKSLIKPGLVEGDCDEGRLEDGGSGEKRKLDWNELGKERSAKVRLGVSMKFNRQVMR